jgi:Ala-tRNA(Pro) deacylase
MGVPDTVTNFLHAHGIDFRLIEHPPSRFSAETATTAHVPPARLAKAVVLEDGSRYVLAVVPANRMVDAEAIARVFDGHFELAPEEDFPMLFRDCRPGAVPPIGEAYGIQTIVDDAMTKSAEVYLEAGDHEHLIRLEHDAFMRLIEHAERYRISYRAN